MQTQEGRRTKEGLSRLHEAVNAMQILLQEHSDTLLEIRPRILAALTHADKERLELVLDDVGWGGLGLIWTEAAGQLRDAIDSVDE